MKCHEIRSKIPAYLDRTLSPTERSFVQVHLKECHECQKVMLSYSSVQNRELLKVESNQNIRKTGFKPKRSGTKNQDVQTILQAAGLIAPMSTEKAGILVSEFSSQGATSTLFENSGEELLRKHMLVMLAAEEEKAQEYEAEETQDYFDDTQPISQLTEPEFQWTREMSLEAAMSGGGVEEAPKLEDDKEDSQLPPAVSSLPNWQVDPLQYVEIPYIHPVTRSEVLKKVRRNSMEGILFLESEAEKTRETETKQEEIKLPFETIIIKEFSGPILGKSKKENQERTVADIAKERLSRQITETEQNSEIYAKPRTINQTAKTLPFRENAKKQAVLYRFFSILLLLALSVMFFFLWQNQTFSFLSSLL
jgi:hypothetical protein